MNHSLPQRVHLMKVTMMLAVGAFLICNSEGALADLTSVSAIRRNIQLYIRVS